MAQKDLSFISTVVLLRDTHGTNKEIQQGELTRIGYAKKLTNIESVSHAIEKQDGHPSGAVYKLCGDFSSNLPSKSAEIMYCITPVSISIKFDPKLGAAFSDIMTRSSLLNFEEQKDCVVITGPIESVMIFLNDLDQQGAKSLLTNKSNVATATSDYLSSEPEAIPALSTSQYGHNVYDNMSPDALALLEKLPIGLIKGVHYDPSAGRVLIDKETPQLEEERISKFQSAYQSITGKKLKIITVPVPSGASPDAVATLVHQYNVTYDQCVFTQQGGVIKIISVSSRQIDQAKVLLSEDIKKAMSSAKGAKEKFKVIHLSTDRTLSLKKGELVKEEVDIIVNPTNKKLSHTGGVAAALNRASNDQLQKYSNRYVQKRGLVPVGSVAITESGGALKCSKVIHAVGPERFKNSEAESEQLINRVVNEALKGAEIHNATSISFPAISTGIFGVKKELVARCVVDTIMAYHFTKPSPVLSDIRIVIIDEKTYAPFAHYFQKKQKTPVATKNTKRSVIQPANFNPSPHDTTKPPTSIPTSPFAASPPLLTSPVPESNMGKTTENDTILSEASLASTTSASKTQDEKLSLKDIGRIQHLLRSLSNDWRALGSALGFQKATLDKMSVIPADSNIQLGRLLNRWLAGDAHSPTVSVLVNALHCIEGTNDVVQGIVTAYGQPAIPTEGGDINNILYPTNFSDLNPSLSSDGSFPTPSTTITTSAGGQLSNLSTQMSVDESTQASATGTKDRDQQEGNQYLPNAARGLKYQLSDGGAKPVIKSSKQQENSDECPICLSEFNNRTTTKCGHAYCKSCLKNALKHSPYCPKCKTPLQKITGNQPEGGTMTHQVLHTSLPGYEKYSTIKITYTIPSGRQTHEHPNPGKSFVGTTCVAYLPNTPEGVEVFHLLKKAFTAHMIFTVGKSVATGRENTVVWNDIHHKTSMSGGPYGYPDPGYLERVKQDLAAKGILPDEN